METGYIVGIALMSPAALLYGALLARWLWRERGRRRLQRRTEARLHEDGKRRLLRARDKVKAELRSNGASLPAATGTSGDGQSGRRTS